MKETLTDRIKKANLTQRERKCIELLTKDLGKTVFLSGSQMAELCGVSAASMTRLVRKLGYEKLSDFRSDLERFYKKLVSPHEMFENYLSVDHEREVVKQSLSRDLSNISMMENMLNMEVLQQVAHMIEKARKVYVVGMFSSEIVVRALGHYLWRLGIDHKEFIGLGLSKKFEYSDMCEGDVLIAISSQRIFKEVVACAELARKNGLVTIAITDNYTNPLGCICQYVLAASVRGVVLDCTQVASLALVNIIVNLIAVDIPDVVAENLEQEAAKCDRKDLFCV